MAKELPRGRMASNSPEASHCRAQTLQKLVVVLVGQLLLLLTHLKRPCTGQPFVVRELCCWQAYMVVKFTTFVKDMNLALHPTARLVEV